MVLVLVLHFLKITCFSAAPYFVSVGDQEKTVFKKKKKRKVKHRGENIHIKGQTLKAVGTVATDDVNIVCTKQRLRGMSAEQQ